MGLYPMQAAQSEPGTLTSSYIELGATLPYFFPLYYFPHFLWLPGAPLSSPLGSKSGVLLGVLATVLL